MRGIADIFTQLATLLPPWAVAVLAIGVAVLALPRLRAASRDKRARGLLRQAARAAPEQRIRLIDRALEAAGRDPDALYSLARDAQERQLPHARQTAIDRLRQTPRGRRLHRELSHKQGPAPERVPTAFERAATIRSLWIEGRQDEALVRLEEATRRFPQDADLQQLRHQIDAERAPRDPHTVQAEGPRLDVEADER